MTSDRLEFTRQSERRTSDEKLRAGLEFIAQTAIGKYGGWEFEIGTITAWERWELQSSRCPQHVREAMTGSYAQWHFSSWIEFRRNRPASPDPERAKEREAFQREDIYQRAALTGHSQRFGTHPWICKSQELNKKVSDAIIVGDTVEEEREKGEDREIDPVADVEPVSLSTISHVKPGEYFNHLFGLDAQIRILISSIQAAADSNMENRFHSLLVGEPGTGKTDILRSTYKLLSDLNISCLSIDATSTTEAGMRKYLLDEDEILPEVILIEEIEKAVHSFKLLLGIMDNRGTVSQMNARRTASRKVPALILANANDYNVLVKMDSGALLSRFSNEIYCPRLDRETLARILEREVGKVKNGKVEWIEPTLVFGFDGMGINDPRQLKRICLCGKDDLLTGKYQKDLEKTMKRAVGSGNGSMSPAKLSKILDMGDI